MLGTNIARNKEPSPGSLEPSDKGTGTPDVVLETVEVHCMQLWGVGSHGSLVLTVSVRHDLSP